MALMSKLNDWFGFDEKEYYQQEQPTKNQPDAPKPAVNAKSQPAQPSGQKMVSLAQIRSQAANKQIAIAEPRVFGDAKNIAKQLLAHQAVVVNFSHINDTAAQRVIDFLTGVVFAVDGQIQRVGERIFLVTPHDYEVDGTDASNFSQMNVR